MISTMSILGLWTWDNTIFDSMSLPDGIELESVRDNILYRLANLEILYPSPPFMKMMIELWSKTELAVWQRMYNAMLIEYNPLENYDRVEDWTDDKENSVINKQISSGESRDSGNNTTTYNNVDEHYVTGYNEPSMVTSSKDANTSQTLESPNLKRNVDNTVDTKGNGTEQTTHAGRVHGNIGVTTSQQMLDAELNISPKLNIINYIVESFKQRFCIMVY